MPTMNNFSEGKKTKRKMQKHKKKQSRRGKYINMNGHQTGGQQSNSSTLILQNSTLNNKQQLNTLPQTFGEPNFKLIIPKNKQQLNTLPQTFEEPKFKLIISKNICNPFVVPNGHITQNDTDDINYDIIDKYNITNTVNNIKKYLNETMNMYNN